MKMVSGGGNFSLFVTFFVSVTVGSLSGDSVVVNHLRHMTI